MSSLADIRSALADALNAVSGLSAYEVVPGQVNTPAAVIAPDGIEYDTDFEHGATYNLPVQFLVSLGDWGTAQRVLDAFISHDGTGVEAVNGVTDFECRVVRMEGYGLTEFAQTNYLGTQLIVEVIL